MIKPWCFLMVDVDKLYCMCKKMDDYSIQHLKAKTSGEGVKVVLYVLRV